MRHSIKKLIIVLGCAALLGGKAVALDLSRLNTMKMLFFPSAACFCFPDGGVMVFDIGKGITPGMITAVRKRIIGSDLVYRFLSAFGWRPRIDWLLLASRGGQWDYKCVDALMSFNVSEVYFPFDIGKHRRLLGKGSTELLLQLSLSSDRPLDLSAREIDLIQSSSGARFVKLLPDHITKADDREDGKAAVCFLIEYKDVRVLVAGELAPWQQKRLLTAPERIKADIFFHPDNLDPALVEAVGAVYDISFDTPPRAFTTDGKAVTPEE
jgi:hypothetical protein